MCQYRNGILFGILQLTAKKAKITKKYIQKESLRSLSSLWLKIRFRSGYGEIYHALHGKQKKILT